MEWWIAGLGGLLLLAAAVGPVGGGNVLRWGPPALVVWLYVWFFVSRRLAGHRRSVDGQPLGRLGPGTWLSLARAWLLAALAGFLLLEEPVGLRAWLPMALYTAAAVADYFDGFLARTTGTSSPLGADLDLELDALGLLIAVSLAVAYGTLGVPFLLLGLGRYAFSLLIALRQRSGRPVHDLPPSLSRRPIAGVTMGFVSAALWPIFEPPVATVGGIPILVAFVASFVRDGAVVAGWLDSNSPRYREWRQRVRRGLLQWAPVGLRVALVALVVPEIAQLWAAPPELRAGLAEMGWADPTAVARIFAGATALFSLAIAAGLAARFAAFGLLLPMTLTLAAIEPDIRRGAALFVAVTLLLLGSGGGSLWRPSDRVFRQRAGEATPDLEAEDRAVGADPSQGGPKGSR